MVLAYFSLIMGHYRVYMPSGTTFAPSVVVEHLYQFECYSQYMGDSYGRVLWL